MTDRARPTLITPKLALSSLPPLTLPPLAYLASAFCMFFFFFLVLVRLSLSCSLSSFPLPSFVSSFPSPPLASLCCSLVASRSPFPSFPSSPSLPFLLSRCALSSARRLRARRRISRTKESGFIYAIHCLGGDARFARILQYGAKYAKYAKCGSQFARIQQYGAKYAAPNLRAYYSTVRNTPIISAHKRPGAWFTARRCQCAVAEPVVSPSSARDLLLPPWICCSCLGPAAPALDLPQLLWMSLLLSPSLRRKTDKGNPKRRQQRKVKKASKGKESNAKESKEERKEQRKERKRNERKRKETKRTQLVVGAGWS